MAVGGVGASDSETDATCGIVVMGAGAGGVAGAGNCVEGAGDGAGREEGGVASTECICPSLGRSVEPESGLSTVLPRGVE